MKGLSPVIAVVLMVAVAVAAAVLAYIWAMGLQSAVQAKARNKAEGILGNRGVIKIEAVDINSSDVISVTIRNIGDVDLTGSFCLYVNGASVGCTSTESVAKDATLTLDSTKISNLPYSHNANSGDYVHIKVTGPTGAEYEVYTQVP